MKAYSEDLRRKIVEALNRGTNKSQTARLFGVSLSSVKCYARMTREGRPLAPKKAPGMRLKIDDHGKRLVAGRPQGASGCDSLSEVRHAGSTVMAIAVVHDSGLHQKEAYYLGFGTSRRYYYYYFARLCKAPPSTAVAPLRPLTRTARCFRCPIRWSRCRAGHFG